MEECDGLVVQLDSGAQEAIGKREEGEILLVVKRDQLRTRLNAVEAQIEENRVAKEKLLAVVADRQKMKLLPPVSRAMAESYIDGYHSPCYKSHKGDVPFC